MGWKSVVRSINAANNRAIKAQERNQRQIERQTEKIHKKIEAVAEHRNKIEEALKTDLASGKVNSADYTLFLKRMDDITDELLVFGKAAGIALGKRYVCGKINKDEFEKLRTALVPTGVYQEKDRIRSQITQIQNNIETFQKNCSTLPDACSHCKKPKKFFRWLREEDGFLLCGKCRNEYKNLKHYTGFTGVYVKANQCEVEEKMTITISILQEYL